MRELLYVWSLRTFDVLVPKKRGSGFLKVPLGHHADPKLSVIETAAKCDLTGLDGYLCFVCDYAITMHKEKREAWLTLIMPMLESHYGCPSREISHLQFFTLIT